MREQVKLIQPNWIEREIAPSIPPIGACVMTSWDPDLYQRIHTPRPFRELLARIQNPPAHVIDLGCGPGTSTAAVAGHWPDAYVVGIDSSPDMVAAARRRHPELVFRVGDLLEYDPVEDQPELIISNSAFQWAAQHERRFPGWIGSLPNGGALAFHIPEIFSQSVDRIFIQLCKDSHWKAKLGHLQRPPGPTAKDYLCQLVELGCFVDAWETVYYEVITVEAIIDRMRATCLRLALSILTEEERTAFLAEYRASVSDAYTTYSWGTVLPSRHISVVAVKRSTS